jgi:hypothetical protein
MVIMDARALSLLDSANNEGYGNARLPCMRDEEIAGVVRLIDGPEAFVHAKAALGHGHGAVLAAFAERMASLAVRTRSLQSLRDGLGAEQLSLAVIGDSRDSLPGLSLLFRASEILEVDPKVEFAAVAALAAPPDNQPLLDFVGRDAEDRSLVSMGYIEDRDDDGFRFERTW